MTTITPGSGSTLKSATLENRLLEAFILLAGKQITTSPFDSTVLIDINEKSATVNYSLPASHSIGTDGNTVIAGIASTPASEFSKGDGGTFVSESLVGQLVEMLMFGQAKEIVQFASSTSANKIIANFDSDIQRLAGNYICDLDITVDATNGAIKVLAKEFLT
ncbi:MAG: hypothetical protein HC836_40355 [Richelia sp. RM2_1_2]|nr:hypothetical protein [Richelia sp. RM2_1_2]